MGIFEDVYIDTKNGLTMDRLQSFPDISNVEE